MRKGFVMNMVGVKIELRKAYAIGELFTDNPVISKMLKSIYEARKLIGDRTIK